MQSLLLFGIFYSILATSGAILIRLEIPGSTLEKADDFLKFLFNWRVLMGFALIGMSALIQIKALSIWEFSRVIPITTAIYFAFTGLVGVLLFKEELRVCSVAGMMLIIVGIGVMNMKTA